MRKHFLILMLMALLPLAGWAQTATFGEMSLGKYTYGANTFPVPQVKDAEGAILTEGTHYTVVDHAFKDEDCTQVINEGTPANLKAMKTDGTRYYRKVEGKGTYVGQTAVAWFTVAKAELTLTYEDDALDRTYGDAPVAVVKSKFTVSGKKFAESDATLLKGSDPTYSTANNNAGNGKAVTWIGGYTADNYTIKYADYTLDIARKDIGSTSANPATVTVWQGNVVYTGNDIIPVYTVKDGETTLVAATNALQTNNDYSVTAAFNVGAYAPTITFLNNYKGTIAIADAKKFNVTPAPIVVSIDDIEKTYDGTNWKDYEFVGSTTPVKFNYSGLVGADLADAATIAAIKGGFNAPTSVKITTDAQDVKDGGYNLTISGATTGTSTNYEIAEYIPGKLIINKATLELKAKDASKGIDAADPEFELDATANLVAGHVIKDVTFTRAGGETAGTYAITPDYSVAKVYSGFGTLAQKDETGNYKFAIAATKGKLTIGKSTIYVTIKDDEKFYGQADPEFEYVVTGLAEGDNLGDFIISRAGAGTVAGENVGSYALTAEVDNPNTDKYEKVVVASGIFTIKKAQLTFTIPAQNVVTGNKKTALKQDNITVAGIFKAADIANPGNLYTLDFNTVAPNNVALGGTNSDEITAEDKTYAGGILLTLKPAAQANYEVTGDNKVVPADPSDPVISATGKLIVNDGTAALIELTCVDGDYTTIKNHAGEIQDVTIDFNKRTVATPAAKWDAQKWNTLVLPFDIEVAELSYKFGYAVVNVLDKAHTTGTKVAFKLEMGTIPANTPFTIKTAKKLIKEGTDAVGTYVSATGVFGFNDKTIKAPTAAQMAGADAGNGCLFIPVYQTKTIDNTMPLLRFLMGNKDKWVFVEKATTTWDVIPFAAYIDVTGAGANASEMIFTFQEADGSTTAIKAVDMDFAGSEKSYNVDGWYTLNGVKLQGAPTEKGVYINNGKKVVIK